MAQHDDPPPVDPRADQLDRAIERLLAGEEWDDLTPADVAEAEEFRALVELAASLVEEGRRLTDGTGLRDVDASADPSI